MFKNNTKYIKDNMVIKKNHLNILIIDNNIITFNLFKNIFETRGHTVNTIAEPINCVNELLKNNYDIIFLDYKLIKIADILLTDLLRNVLNYKGLIFAYTDNKKNILKDTNNDLDGIIIKPDNIKCINKIINLFETIKLIDNEYILNKRNIDSSLILFNNK